MPTPKPPYPAEFRQQTVELVRAGRSAAQLSREFNVSSTSIAKWLTQSAPTDGDRRPPGRDSLSKSRAPGARPTAPREPAAAARARHSCKGYGLVRREGREDVHWVYQLVNANQAALSVEAMCRVLQVSTSGYCGWIHRTPSRRSIDNAVLVERIRAIHAESDATYGMPRVRAERLDQGLKISGKRIARNASPARMRSGTSSCIRTR